MKNTQSRIYLFDNFRFLMIFSVVFAHCCEMFEPSHESLKYVIFIIYLFHVPGLVFISGYCSKRINMKSTFKLLYQYIIFNTLYVFLINLVLNGSLSYSLIVPQWTFWYLFALFIWKLVLYWVKIPKKLIPLFFIITIFIGLVDQVGGYFSLSRIICFFPFFLVGYHFDINHVEKIKSINKYIIVGVTFVVFGLSLYFVRNEIIPLYLQWYRSGFVDDVQGLYSRLILIIMSVSCLIVLINLIPNKKNFITKYGENTITIYVFHALLLMLFSPYILKINYYGKLYIPTIIVVSLFLTWLLSTKFVKNLYEIFMIPYNKLVGRIGVLKND